MADSRKLQAILKQISRDLSSFYTVGTCKPLWVKISLKWQKNVASFYVSGVCQYFYRTWQRNDAGLSTKRQRWRTL